MQLLCVCIYEESRCTQLQWYMSSCDHSHDIVFATDRLSREGSLASTSSLATAPEKLSNDAEAGKMLLHVP